jgi:hypothetical protein
LSVIALLNDIELQASDALINVNRPLTVTTLNGTRSIIRGAGSEASFFQVNAGGELTLGYSNGIGLTLVQLGDRLTLDGGAEQGLSAGSPLITVNGGMLVMKHGTVLQNNHTTNSSCGGVLVNQGGIFIMENGTITGNTSAGSGGHGGGVYLVDGTFIMESGIISKNTAEGNEGRGGGVSIYNGAFTMKGGTIAGNTARGSNFGGRGGGVSIYNGTFTMKDGTITGNTARATNSYSYGGGVSVESGTIAGNTAESAYSGYGGGVSVEGGTFVKGPAAPSGIIYGYISGDADSNTVKDSSGSPVSGQGHAVYAGARPKKRDALADPDDALDSTIDGGPGGWDE